MCSLFKPIWVFGQLVLSLNTYTGVHMVRCFMTIHVPYDVHVLCIMWVFYENIKSRRLKSRCCDLLCVVPFDKTLYLHLSSSTRIKFGPGSGWKLICDGLVSHPEGVYDFHPISTTETRNKITTLICWRKNENIINDTNTSNELAHLFTGH